MIRTVDRTPIIYTSAPGLALPVVRALEPEERQHAAAIVTRAFFDDPIARWVLPDSESYQRHFPPFVDAFAGAAFDFGTAFATADLLATGLWLPPGAHPDGERMGEILAAAVSPERLAEIAGFAEAQERLHPEEEHWYLPLIGVEPGAQGKGAGSALLDRALWTCDQLGMPAYLEARTERNRALYARHGFKVINVIQYGSSPPMWGMYRAANARKRA